MYVSEWEALGDALRRLTESDTTEEQAKTDLCGGIADRKIRIRVRIDPTDRQFGGRVIERPRVEAPEHLRPEDLDWDRSRPVSVWPTFVDDHRAVHSLPPTPRVIDLIELNRSDTDRVLLGVMEASGPLDKALAAQLFMRAYVMGHGGTHGKPKRDPTIRLCAREARVTYREATAAWNDLPSHWKNPPRKPQI
jgi:hypothetical protein